MCYKEEFLVVRRGLWPRPLDRVRSRKDLRNYILLGRYTVREFHFLQTALFGSQQLFLVFSLEFRCTLLAFGENVRICLQTFVHSSASQVPRGAADPASITLINAKSFGNPSPLRTCRSKARFQIPGPRAKILLLRSPRNPSARGLRNLT